MIKEIEAEYDQLEGTNTMTDTHEAWKLLSPEKPFSREVRALHHTNKNRVENNVFRPVEYKAQKEFKCAVEQYAADLNDQGYNVYFSLKPIKQSFTGASASDDDILQYELLTLTGQDTRRTLRRIGRSSWQLFVR